MTAPLLIHAGLHKTGTTWLQRRVFEAKHGTEIQYCGNLNLLYRQFLLPDITNFSPAAARSAFDPILNTAAGAGQLAVISGENLAGRPFHARHQREIVAERLAATFPDACILLTIREQEAILYSMYGQYLRFGYSSSLRSFLRQPPPGSSFRPVLDLIFYDYAHLVRTYEQFFPPENILVVPFERMVADPNAVLSYLVQKTGCTLSAMDPESSMRSANAAWSDLAYEALRHLNRFNSQDSRWQHKPGRFSPNSVARYVDRLTPSRLRRSMLGARRRLIREIVGDYYARSNTLASARIGIDLAQFGYRTS